MMAMSESGSALAGLADAIEALRTELSQAVAIGAGKPIQFELEPVELTVQAVVTNTKEGGLSWKILKAGVSHEREDTHTVKLTLRPVWQTPDGQVVSDFKIASASYGDQVDLVFG
jgi:Trypsin-co-occurring domain 2